MNTPHTTQELEAELANVRAQIEEAHHRRNEAADRILEERSKQPLSQRFDRF
jgi:hypothetical protein